MISAHKKLLTALSLACFVPGLVSCETAKSDEDSTEEVRIPVAVSPARIDRITASYKTTTSLEAPAEATVVAKLSGVVTHIEVEEGMQVKAGDRLARLDDERLKLELQRATARHAQARNELARSEKLFQKNLISRDEYERKRFEADAAQAERDLAQLNLRESVIRAPIRGVVSQRLIKLGNMVQLNSPTFQITDLRSLEAQLHIPERDIPKLAPGQKVKLLVDTWPGKDFHGEVLRISPVVDPKSGTVQVSLSIQNQDAQLKPGMFGRVQITYDEKPAALLIPKDAVQIEDAAASVFVIVDGKAARRDIVLGYSDQQHYEVLKGLSEGDLVVTIGKSSLKDGTAADIVETRS